MSYIYVCVYACVCAHICICVYMYIYVCVSIYIYICVYIYVYTHTYIWLKNYLIYNLSLFLSFGVLIHFYKIANGKSCRWSVFVDCGFLSVYKVIILLSLISFLHSCFIGYVCDHIFLTPHLSILNISSLDVFIPDFFVVSLAIRILTC